MPSADVTQYKEVFHVPKDEFRNIITSNEFKSYEFKVFCYLLTDLNGFNSVRRELSGKAYTDPCNFKRVDATVVADELLISEKKVKAAIEKLVNFGILEKGKGASIKNGYRFTF